MSTVKRDIGVLVLAAIILGVFAYFAFPLSKTRLGLDLQGGLSVVLEAQDTVQTPFNEDGMVQAVKIIQDRVNKLGVSEPEIQRQGTHKISIQLPGIDNPEEALGVIGKTAVLEFYDVSKFGTPYASEAEALSAAGVSSANQLVAPKKLIEWGTKGDNTSSQWFIVESEPALNGGMLKNAQQGYESVGSKSKVDMQFTNEGAQKFAEVTGRMAETLQITGETQYLAIVLDGVVESAPTVRQRIDGGNAEITGSFTLQEARNLALVLQTGALPIELKPVSQNNVGATLGKTALDQALLAGLIGFALIILFMIIYYRLLGVVASIALLAYGVLFLGVHNAIGITLTLPGIAGMLLTLGMAVDANVLIFARVRDEVASGKRIGPATGAGFRKAFSAVFDCNMTTIITAVILFWSTTGAIRGFALTLGVGVALSMFTAVLVTRSMLSVLSGWKVFRHPKALGLHIPKTQMLADKEGSEL